MPRPHGCNDESLCSPMLIESISPQMDSDCTRLTRADHTVSTSTRGEYGALSMARAAGGLEAVPMACNARICSVAAPFHQCLTHGLPGLQLRRAAGERVSPERLAGCTPDQKWGLQRYVLESRFEVRARGGAMRRTSARLRGAYATFFAKAYVPTVFRPTVNAARSRGRARGLAVSVTVGSDRGV